MEHKNYLQLVDLWQKYASNGLTPEVAQKAVAETLSLPWVQQINVFSDQAVILLELHTLNYLYKSPSIEKITGYPLNSITGANFYVSLLPQEEFETVMNINNIYMKRLSELKLPPSEMMKMRGTYNHFLRRKDGSEINVLNHYINLVLNSEGLPLLQLVIISDITSFNSRPEHFYKAVIVNDDETDHILFSGKIENDEELISPREREILKLVSHGQSSESIAHELNISVDTVKAHRKNLLEKTKAKDAIDLVRHGYAHGWL